mgnify:CR=1 FL=1
MEKERKNALEMAEKEKEKNKKSAEKESRRAIAYLLSFSGISPSFRFSTPSQLSFWS